MTRAAVLGLGDWGRNWVRTLCQIPDVESVVAVDSSEYQRQLVQERFPGVDIVDDSRKVLQDPAVDAVIIATPASTHAPLALACLRAEKHVLVEKPAAMSRYEAARLVDMAEKQGVILMAGHTALFTPEMRCVNALVEQGDLGSLVYFESYHGNLGVVRPDASVLWDLAPHPMAVFTSLFDPTVTCVQASGLNRPIGRLDTCHISLTTSQGAIAQVAVSWRSPIKTRRWVVGGTRRTVVVDELAPTGRVQVFDVGLDLPRIKIQPRSAVWVPPLDTVEPLQQEFYHFLSATNGGRCLAGGPHLLNVTDLLERAQNVLGGRSDAR